MFDRPCEVANAGRVVASEGVARLDRVQGDTEIGEAEHCCLKETCPEFRGNKKKGEPGANTAATHNKRQENCRDMENKPQRTTPMKFLKRGNANVASTPNKEPTPRMMLNSDSVIHCV